MRLLGSAMSVAVLTACGPTPGSDETGDPTTGAPTPGVCLEPVPDGLPLAEQALMCVEPDMDWGSFHFDISQWPALEVPDDEFCSGNMVDVLAPCTVQVVSVSGDASSVTLRCEDDAGAHTMNVEIDTPWLRFPVCEGDDLTLHYFRANYGCWNGYGETVVLRGADDRLLAASFDGNRPEWLTPLLVDMLGDAGCEFIPNPCGGTERSAMSLGVGGAPVYVYDQTRRIIETPTRYVANVNLEWVDESLTCGEGGGPADLDLALVDP